MHSLDISGITENENDSLENACENSSLGYQCVAFTKSDVEDIDGSCKDNRHLFKNMALCFQRIKW